MKFKVGDRVKCPWGDGIVDRVAPDYDRDPPLSYYVKHGRGAGWHEGAELELVQSEVAKEPVPGKFYRTRGGDKVFYVGNSLNNSFVYQGADDGIFVPYDLPFRYTDDEFTGDRDVVGEWAEETKLPSLEIKRWAIITAVDDKWHPRGRVIDVCASHDKALDIVKEYETDLEIVELTGVIPGKVV